MQVVDPEKANLPGVSAKPYVASAETVPMQRRDGVTERSTLGRHTGFGALEQTLIEGAPRSPVDPAHRHR